MVIVSDAPIAREANVQVTVFVCKKTGTAGGYRAMVPGGWCGSHGACGAGVGVGIAISALTEATPLTGKTRALANEAAKLRFSTASF